MIPILFILGCIFIGWLVISTWRHQKEQCKIQETVARNVHEAAARKARREEGRERRTTIQEWEKEFIVLNATQFFNPRRGNRLTTINFERHDYKAEIEQSVNETGIKIRRLAVSDKEGRLVKVKVITDNMEAHAYRDCTILDSTGRIIGGWQLAHEEIPYEFIAASINIGYFYPDTLNLPTTVSVGYHPNLLPAGGMTVVRYTFLINGRIETFAEKYLEEHFMKIFPKHPSKAEVVFKKSSSELRVSPAAEPFDASSPLNNPIFAGDDVRRLKFSRKTRQITELIRDSSRRLQLFKQTASEPKQPSVDASPRPLGSVEASKERDRNQESQPRTVSQRLPDDKQADRIKQRVPAPVESDAKGFVITIFGYFDKNCFNFTTQQAFASMLLRRKQLETAIQAGNILSIEEQKEHTILCFLLGSPGGNPDDEPLIKLHTINLEDVKGVRAIGEFTFGDINKYAVSPTGMIRLFDGIHSNLITIDEAKIVLEESKKWDAIKNQTCLSREAFFAEKLSALTQFERDHLSNN